MVDLSNPRMLYDHIAILTPGKIPNLQVAVRDDPGPNGANHRYVVLFSQPEAADEGSTAKGFQVTMLPVTFQQGDVAVVGHNGVTPEALIALVLDHLRGKQTGAERSREAALAITHLEDSLHWLHQPALAHQRRDHQALLGKVETIPPDHPIARKLIEQLEAEKQQE